MLPPGSPEPGPWRTDRVPFWRDIYEAFTEPETDTIIVACGAQMSKTEGIFNILGHRFSDGPYVPAIYVGPTEKQVRSISKDRIDKMLRSTPVLWERTAKGQRYTTFEKWIAGIRLGFAWAGSATELASHPAGIVLVDERDRMDSNVGSEGDPVELARARLKNYPAKKLGVMSTPTLEGSSPTWALLEDGSLEFWSWPCVHCNTYFVPTGELLHVPDSVTAERARELAVVVCPHCGGELTDKDKAVMNALGRYIRHRRLGDGERAEHRVLRHYVVDDDPPPTRARSFWISGLASPWATFGDIARVVVQAQASGDEERLQAVINTWLGELYALTGDAPDEEEVAANRLDYDRLTIPSRDIQLITLGADVQRDGIFYTIRGWAHGEESWQLDHDFLAGATEHAPVWEALRAIILRKVADRPINRAFIDSGFRPGDRHRRPDHAVYTFCRSLPGLAFPTKGRDTLEAPYQFRLIDYSIGGKTIKGGVKLFHLNTDYAKRWLHARIRWPEDQDGGWHLFRETSDAFCRQMIAEELVIKPNGQASWVVTSRENHYLDCEVNALAAALSLNVQALQPAPEPEKTPKSETTASQSTAYARRPLL